MPPLLGLTFFDPVQKHTQTHYVNAFFFFYTSAGDETLGLRYAGYRSALSP